MRTQAQSIQAWRNAYRTVNSSGGVLTIPKMVSFPHPRDAGAYPTTTTPVGQLADYVFQVEIGAAPLLIREFTDRYEAFVAGVQLAEQAVRFVEENPAAAAWVTGALLGALVGSAVGKNREAALIGAGVGILAAAIFNASRGDERIPNS